MAKLSQDELLCPGQVTYPMWLARLLHRTPLVIAASVPLILGSLGSSAKAKTPLYSVQVFRAAGVVAMSFGFAVIIPAALAAALVLLTGEGLCKCTKGRVHHECVIYGD